MNSSDRDIAAIAKLDPKYYFDDQAYGQGFLLMMNSTKFAI